MHTVTLPYEALSSAIDALKPIAKKNSVIPITSCVLVTAGAAGTTLRATDLEVTLERLIPGIPDAGTPFAFAIEMEVLEGVVKSVGGSDLALSYNDEDRALRITAGAHKYAIGCDSADDFPKPAVAPDSTAAQVVDNAALIAAIAQVAPVCGKVDARPAMSGVCLWQDNKSDGVVAVSTDSSALSRSPRIAGLAIGADVVKDGHVVLSAGGAKALAAFATADEITMRLTASNLWVETDTARLTMRLIDARFPSWPMVVPEYNQGFEVDRVALATALKVAQVAANKMSSCTRFKLEGGTLTVSSADVDFSREATSSLPVQDQTCPDFTISFSARHFSTCLQTLSGDTVRILTSGAADKAIVMTPLGEDRFTMLMPLELGV